MKYLTPVYLTLMHAFKDAADSCLNNEDYRKNYDIIGLMHEYGTLRIDGGRRTGKTRAVAQFANDWLLEGSSVIILSTRYTQSVVTRDEIISEHANCRSISRLDSKGIRDNVFVMTIRDFLSDSNRFRGINLNRCLIIIDEPMKVPDMNKFYSSYIKSVRLSVMHNTDKLPLFFVIGMQ